MTTLEDAIREAIDSGVAEVLAAIGPAIEDLKVRALTYSVPEAAIALGISTYAVRTLIEEGRLWVVPHLTRRIIPRWSVEHLVAEGQPW